MRYKIQTKLEGADEPVDLISNSVSSLRPATRYFEEASHAQGFIDTFLKNAPGEHSVVEVEDDD